MPETKVPAIPPVPSGVSSELSAFLTAVKEVLQVREGQRGQALDAAVTFRDLVSVGLAEEAPPAQGNAARVGGVYLLPPAVNELPECNSPPPPEGFVVSGALQHIILTWSAPNYRCHDYMEVWRASGETLDTAQRVGTTSGSMYADPVTPSTTYFYWIRSVSKTGQIGPYNSPTGTRGQTALSPEFALSTLNGKISESQLANDLRSSLGALNSSYVVKVRDVGNTEAVSGFGVAYEDGTSQFLVAADRFAVIATSADGVERTRTPFVVVTSPTTINGVAVPVGVYMDSASIANGTITNAKIGNATIESAKIVSLQTSKLTTDRLASSVEIYSQNYYSTYNPTTGAGSGPTGFGWKINADGNAEFLNATVRGTIQATNGYFYGVLANGGSMTWTSGTGLWSGTDNSDSTYKFRIGDGENTSRPPVEQRYVRWDGDDLSIRAAGLTIENGEATFSGALRAASGTFSGSLNGADITGATGKFTGELSAGVIDFASMIGGNALTQDPSAPITVTLPTFTSSSGATLNVTTWNKVRIRVTLVGGGGGGGAGSSYHASVNNTTYAQGGGGGGSGGKTVFEMEVSKTATLVVSAGVGGAAGTTGSGGTGGASTLRVNGSVVATAGGGGGGGFGNYNGGPGAGGSAGTGDVTTPGAAGQGGGQGGVGAPSIFVGGAGGNGSYSTWWGFDNTVNYFAGAAGSAGYALIEVYDPNFVVTNTRFDQLKAVIAAKHPELASTLATI